MPTQPKCMGVCKPRAIATMECPKCGSVYCDLCALSAGIADAEISGQYKKVKGGGAVFKGHCINCGAVLVPIGNKTTKSEKKWWQLWK